VSYCPFQITSRIRGLPFGRLDFAESVNLRMEFEGVRLVSNKLEESKF